MSRKDVETVLMDIVDSIFNDGIETVAELDVNLRDTRAAYLDNSRGDIPDQGGIISRKAKVQVIRRTRTLALADSDKLEDCFPSYAKKFDNSLALTISRNYITSPIKMVVGSQTAYSISVDLTITSI